MGYNKGHPVVIFWGRAFIRSQIIFAVGSAGKGPPFPTIWSGLLAGASGMGLKGLVPVYLRHLCIAH